MSDYTLMTINVDDLSPMDAMANVKDIVVTDVLGQTKKITKEKLVLPVEQTTEMAEAIAIAQAAQAGAVAAMEDAEVSSYAAAQSAIDAENAQSAIILGGIAHDAAAPTPATSGKYYFTTAGSCTWLTGGAVSVLIGQEVLVVLTSPSTYVYTLLAITANYATKAEIKNIDAGAFYNIEDITDSLDWLVGRIIPDYTSPTTTYLNYKYAKIPKCKKINVATIGAVTSNTNTCFISYFTNKFVKVEEGVAALSSEIECLDYDYYVCIETVYEANLSILETITDSSIALDIASTNEVVAEQGAITGALKKTTSGVAVAGSILNLRTFTDALVVGDMVKLRVNCAEGILSSYLFLSQNGTNVLTQTILLPNTDYILPINNGTFTMPFGVYVPSANAIGGGAVGVEWYPLWDKRYVDTEDIKDESITPAKLSSEITESISQGKHFLNGKKLVTLCDSLGNTSQWQTPLAEATGAIYDSVANDNRYSFGGTKTCNDSGQCAQDRAKLIVADGVTPDVIIIENVNDSEIGAGTSGDVAFFKTTQKLLNVTPLASKAEADTYWTNNFAALVGSEAAQIGSVFGVPYTINTALRLTITGAPTAAGDFGITLSSTGAGEKNISVTTADTIQSIIDKIIEYSWNNYVAIQDGNSVLFSNTIGLPAPTITIDAGVTGVTYTTATGQNGSIATWRYFKSHDIAEWSTIAQWSASVSLYSAYKGLIEYLYQNFPSALIYWFMPKTYAFDYTISDYKRADGTLDYDKVLSEKTYSSSLFASQIAFCDYYNIPYIDIRNESNLNPGNLATYMNVNNVHPKQLAYDRWALTIAKLID